MSFLFWRLYCVSFLDNLITCLSCFGDCIVSPSSRITLLVFFVLAIVLCLLPRESHYLSFLFWRLYCVSFLENLITCLFLFWRLYCVSFLDNLITCLSCFGDCIVSPSSRISLLVFFVLAIVLCLLPRESHYLSFLFWRLYCVSFLENLITCLFLFWRLYCVSFLENLITCLFCFGDCIVSPSSRI